LSSRCLTDPKNKQLKPSERKDEGEKCDKLPAKVPVRPDTDLAGLSISPVAVKTTMKSAFCMLVGELTYIAMNTRPGKHTYKGINTRPGKPNFRYMTKAGKSMFALYDKSHQRSL
jgi:hypothetical protein